ncbi:Ubiquitin-conjugating enzyme E2 11 [Tritrichomonas foetus]|uniref:E2 ubiquitin-conjugating enzyme n=1 Tax=Tritrichomonas foetus TaxID=1144522 RepID=A0A1J4JZV5_9EUKA|nr:Ubiquitin-conjugating enzyme E2 11 [Tritrichomonas foetus]|eukprot:OHT02789.1 Ubiquitin-conjugating enzyme E2 11 [Tritrichomonas foetus]
MAQRRIMKELDNLRKTPVENVTAEPIGDDLFHWHANIKGPAGSPYEGGVFVVDIKFPFDYPLKPPKCVFDTKVYHPNVGQHGEICLDILKMKWTPIENISNVLLSLYYLLSTPDPDDSLAAEIASQYKSDRAAFDKTAKEWTELHAKKA